MIQFSPITQQIIVAAIILAAVGLVVRWRIRSAKAKTGSCPKCTVEH